MIKLALFGHGPLVVYVTVYVPSELAARSIKPVIPSITSPAVELNVPPANPVIVGEALPD